MFKYTINHNFFKEWSKDMAYILGLWYADGYISNQHSKDKLDLFGITLNKKDKYLLENILVKMSSSHILYKNRNTYSIAISSKVIVDDIINLGGTARKSLTISFPHVPKNYLPDFIRGFFDGDGSIYKLKYRKGFASNFVSGSKNFIVELKNILEENVKDIKCQYVEKYSKKTKNTYYFIELSQNNTIRLRDYIYRSNDDLRLYRKYEKHILNGEIKLSVADRKFLSYEDAIKVANSLCLKNKREWHKYVQSVNKIDGIPSHPEIIFKDKWKSWDFWLGKHKNVDKTKHQGD